MNKTGQQVKPTGQAGQRKETGLSWQKRDVWSLCLWRMIIFVYINYIFSKNQFLTLKKYGVYFFTPRMHRKCFEIKWPQKCSVWRGMTLRKCTFPLKNTLRRGSRYVCVWVSHLILCELFRNPSWNFIHVKNMEREMQLYRKCF